MSKSHGSVQINRYTQPLALKPSLTGLQPRQDYKSKSKSCVTESDWTLLKMTTQVQVDTVRQQHWKSRSSSLRLVMRWPVSVAQLSAFGRHSRMVCVLCQ